MDINPKNIGFVDLYPNEKSKSSEGKFVTFTKWSERFYSYTFFVFEFVIGISCFLLALRWGYKIVVCYDGRTILKAKAFIEFIQANWIAFICLTPLIFFRIIVIKLISIRSTHGVNFDSPKNASILNSGR